MAEGIQAGRNLAEVREEFNKWLSEIDEVFDEDGGEEAEGDIGEKVVEEPGGGEEIHSGGEETGEKAVQEGAETGKGAETGVGS